MKNLLTVGMRTQETEKAVRILIQAQRDCEEMYLNSPEPELTILEPPLAGGDV